MQPEQNNETRGQIKQRYNNKNISFTDSLGYEEYFDFADIEGCLNNFFIKIVYDDYTEVVKINLEKLPTSSTNLFQKLMGLLRN